MNAAVLSPEPLGRTQAEEFRLNHIFVSCFLASAKHDEFIMRQYQKRSLSLVPATRCFADALWAAHCSLQEQVKEEARQLTKRGQLLFAHEGTTLFSNQPFNQGGAT